MAMVISIILLIAVSGCIDLPLDVDQVDVASREELSRAQVKQTLRSLYGLTEDQLTFVPWYEHFHIYDQSEIEKHFSSWMVGFIADEFEWHEHRSCVWKGTALWLHLTGNMPGLPAFMVDIYPKKLAWPPPQGHLFVGVLVQPRESANRLFLLLNYGYKIPDSRAIQEFDPDTMRLGQIRMTPERMQ